MRAALCTLVIGLLLMTGCGDDESTCVTCPVIGISPGATLENIWPNADSTSWDYNFQMRQWGDWDELIMYENREDVPATPTPSWADIRALLAGDPVGAEDTVKTIAGSYHLMFDGEIEFGDIIAQNLVDRHVIEGGIAIPDNAGSGRLDISKRIQAPIADTFISYPILVHGGKWRKTENQIVSYGDLDQSPSWQFLTDDLSPGDKFKFQLGAGFIEGIYLYCLVDQVLTVETEAGKFRKAIDCLYIIDYGVSVLSGPIGTVQGYFRSIDAGRVIYAPTVGPVYCYERHLVQPGEPGSRGLTDATIDLYDSSTLDD